MSLKEQDRLAWGWAETIDPNQVTSHEVFAAYRICQDQNVCRNKVCKRNCRGNPLCLANLGEARLRENLAKKEGYSELQKRTEGNFVGLKNLGATCYANSLLQLWFHNKAFRDAILSWNAHEDPVECTNETLYEGAFEPKTAVGHLQQLFALMYYSKRRYIDPSPLVKSLGLDFGIQQDAQEFSQLFIALIENNLKHQSLQQVKNVISDTFRGEFMYVTRCCKCEMESVHGSAFDQLELNIKGNSTLADCISDYLGEERLEGANCYSCPRCLSMQEACRNIRLCSLPPVLNLQLMRFVYDREKGQRKKLKSMVYFPESLDMKPYVAGAKEETLVYNLSAVLIHKGPSASSGHFVAYIRDSNSSSWFVYNDESVQRLEGIKLSIDEETPESKQLKPPKLPKGFQSSTNAYMLVYTSERHTPPVQEVHLPEKVQAYVDSENGAFDDFCNEVVAKKEQYLESQRELLNLYENLVVTELSSPDVLERTDALFTDWLVAWIQNKTESLPINNSSLLCPHNRLSPSQVVNAKYVSSSTAESLFSKFGGGPRLMLSESLCEVCVKNRCLYLRTSAQTQNESKEITNLLKKRMPVDEPGYYVSKNSLRTWRSQVLNLIEDKSPGHGHTSGVNEEGLEQEQEMEASEPQTHSTEESSDLMRAADNGKVTKSEVKVRNTKLSVNSAMKKKSQTITVPLSDLRDCFVLCKKLEGDLTKSGESIDDRNSALNQCKELKVILAKQLNFCPRQSKMLNHIRSLPHHRKILNRNGKANLSCSKNEEVGNEVQEKEELPVCTPCNGVTGHDELENGYKSDSGVSSTVNFNENIVCPHGNLSIDESERKLVPVRVWEILRRYFPSAPAFTHNATPCRQCESAADSDEVNKQMLCVAAQNQKAELMDLLSLRNRPCPGKTQENIYILNKYHFYRPWSAFIKSCSKRDNPSVSDPPSSLKLGLLLCEHGLLHYSYQYQEDLNKWIVLATQREWETLLNFYETELAIVVNPDLTTDPALCADCFAARLEQEQKDRLSYERAKITVRLVQPSSTSTAAAAAAAEESDHSDSGVQSKRLRIDESVSPISEELKKVMKSAGAMNGASSPRRSARTRRAPGQKDVQLTVSSTSTLRDVKKMITQHFAVAPFDQHLSTAEGRELTGDSETLFSLGILPHTTLLLRVDEPNESLDEAIEHCIAMAEPEAGFKGTCLLQNY